MNDIQKRLFSLQDKTYGEFQAKLIPTVGRDRIIGVRTPELRRLAKELYRQGNTEDFLADVPHRYFEENQLHAFIISEIKDYNTCVNEVSRFLPYIDNWATCDQLSPKVFKKHKEELLVKIKEWIKDGRTYTVRFAIKMLMDHFAEEDFKQEYPLAVASVKSEEYYVNMMRAWYFATLLAKQYEAVIPLIENKMLDKRTHNTAIQKSLESYRIKDEQKKYLKGLKIK